MKQQLKYLLFLIIILNSTNIFASSSGGPLSSAQAAYDVSYYDLKLSIDHDSRTIAGSLLCKVQIINPIDTLVLDLEDNFTVDSVSYKKGGDALARVSFLHQSGKIYVYLPVTAIAGEFISAVVYYNGAPRVATNPPWGEGGFDWKTTTSNKPWVGVACEGSGADAWWPCKDHPSDEPDSMALSFTVKDPLMCVSNGRYLGKVTNGDNTTTYNWFVSYPINNYNVSIYIAEYSVIEDTYKSVSGSTIPFYFWVLPESLNIARSHMKVFLDEFNFIESICGPFPFVNDKQGWVHSPYPGMEHQSAIAYGDYGGMLFTVNDWGYDLIHYHELAHEWWGNLVTAKDWADVWIHEGLATYMEALYVEHLRGSEQYHAIMAAYRPSNNHNLSLAPRKSITAGEAMDDYTDVDPYYRGAYAVHTLRFHLGDNKFFKLLKRWAYPDSSDYDNTNGKFCRLMSTDDMKNQAEAVTGVELDPFFEVFFREVKYPTLKVIRSNSDAAFIWETETNVTLDLNIPIRVNGIDQTVEMTSGQGHANISINDDLQVDPKKWILMTPPQITLDIEDGLSKISDYQLDQNYPNPFNPVTNIKFTVPKQSFVSLTVFDLHGKEITTLVNEEKTPGVHFVRFDGSDITSGIYFYRLDAGVYSETKKFILLK